MKNKKIQYVKLQYVKLQYVKIAKSITVRYYEFCIWLYLFLFVCICFYLFVSFSFLSGVSIYIFYVIILGAIFIVCNSWNNNLQEYGISTYEKSTLLLHVLHI